ncbi:DNA mismatch repair endonuclease MutL [Flaviaesturariibacter amylovorans]|uniref:DNA mismatch repair protein MutL n=1 Tax=Flaviaesturariibacter amylovorans TaxID=1084520 RepID=A0ABP8HQI1_9BACT
MLPDHIANQIAAGEVIQRPASAVKELLENAVDAGATRIQLIVNDAGKALVQVIDNGSGMSATDARRAFERHATSKIQKIEDLFHIRTMGFRGEALASIAAVAQVELRTRRAEDELGTCIELEHSQVTKQEPVAAPVGTSICMKNLFFNVPARRNFLKSNTSELRHIVDEFIRVALAFPDRFFSLTHNGQGLFHLEAGSLKQRIVQVLGNNYSSKLVAVREDTDYLNVQGFVGKPETAKKTRGDQYFFVNNRFIRSAYLNHAVLNAFQDLISPDAFPSYVLFIELDPAQLDVNVHPTKQEIKFEDEKIVYAFVQAAIKHALAQFSITPTLDFELDASIQGLSAVQGPFTEQQQSAARASSLYQGFTGAHQAHRIEASPSAGNGSFRSLTDIAFEGSPVLPLPDAATQSALELRPDALGHGGASPSDVVIPRHSEGTGDGRAPSAEVFGEGGFTSLQQAYAVQESMEVQQLFSTYILVAAERSFLLVHQQSAHERVLYERLMAAMHGKPVATQRSLFPSTLELAPPDAVLLTELLPDLARMGYSIEPFGPSSFIIQGTPADVESGNEKAVLERILEQTKHFSEVKLPRRETLLRSVALQQSIKPGTQLTDREMQRLVDDLFRCRQPNATPGGKPTYVEFAKDGLDKMFGR